MAKVFKNGNSLAVVIPKEYAHQISVRAGSEVDWRKGEEGLVLSPHRKGKKATDIDPKVAELIEKISKKYTQVWEDLSEL